ncbi:hypothetical protein SAMN04489712_120143 [Thermomonospora echinospora]|uniref:Uncharacterized protein n=1 Tax=Thermomonospora echinospora TaxID=1992 RepID=A0A1H6DQ69_9ACTN|nr:hypothetical protein [Thermomonospora echinospora]SEG87492.1 hypothetical protein SAMN04489712_120143 [Thermomonospora echinospora]
MGKHAKKVDCSSCSGTGKMKIGNNGTTTTIKCTMCKGTGKV